MARLAELEVVGIRVNHTLLSIYPKAELSAVLLLPSQGLSWHLEG